MAARRIWASSAGILTSGGPPPCPQPGSSVPSPSRFAKTLQVADHNLGGVESHPANLEFFKNWPTDSKQGAFLLEMRISGHPATALDHESAVRNQASAFCETTTRTPRESGK